MCTRIAGAHAMFEAPLTLFRRLLIPASFALIAGAVHAAPTAPAGIQFQCEGAALAQLRTSVPSYFDELGIDAAHYAVVRGSQSLTFTLTTAAADTVTTDFKYRPEYRLSLEPVSLPAAYGKSKTVHTVSRKEIALSLMQHGRLTTFTGTNCSLQALKGQIGLRQSIVAWTEKLEWGWPDGGPAKWNNRLWKAGTPRKGVAPAVQDAFNFQNRYAIGCYTASKLVIVQGFLDFYGRRERDQEALSDVTARLWSDGDPLVNVEPPAMWSFEEDYDKANDEKPGKLLQLHHGVAPGNFVPGDWAYFRNTDPATADKTGYEGSNAIYLGFNRFDDYYNDNAEGSYAYREKLAEVYQWRHGVFSRSHDIAKAKPLTFADYEALGRSPEQGGLVMNVRMVPVFIRSTTPD